MLQQRPPADVHERDFVGYADAPPYADWPGGARIAVNFVLNYEEGSEYSIGDGDGRSETALTEVLAARVPTGDRDLASESMYEYGTRVGFWRVAAAVRGPRTSDDGVWLRAGPGAQRRRGGALWPRGSGMSAATVGGGSSITA